MGESKVQDGWVVIDKAAGVTSRWVSSGVRRQFSVKVGHAGTLDPFATGILPVAFGRATRLIPFLFSSLKTYVCQIEFGCQTDTDDCTGQVIHTTHNIPTLHDIQTVLPRFMGYIQQVPSTYSAVKVGGRRAYDLARSGVDFVLSPKTVYVEDIQIQDYSHKILALKVRCGTGFYVRALGRDLAFTLGSLGYVKTLRRTQVGPFFEKNSVELDIFKEKLYNQENRMTVLPLDFGVASYMPLIKIQPIQKMSLWQGRTVDYIEADKEYVGCLCNEKLVAIGRLQDNRIIPYRCFVDNQEND